MPVQPLVLSTQGSLIHLLPIAPTIETRPATHSLLTEWGSVRSWAELQDQLVNQPAPQQQRINRFNKRQAMMRVGNELGTPLIRINPTILLPDFDPTRAVNEALQQRDLLVHHVDFSLTTESYPGLSGAALLEAVAKDARQGFRPKSYKESKAAIFSTIDSVVIDGVRGVFSSYSNVFVPGTSGNGGDYDEHGDENEDGHIDSGMNIEHIWPQSYFNKRNPMRADVHHLLSTFMYPNNRRSRLPFGEVKDEDVVYKTCAGARASKYLFEPPNEAKGEVARALFYFFAMYHKSGILPPNAIDKFWHDQLPTLMRWNLEYPPSPWEKERNNRIQAFQGNRNPFVDNYLLAERIGIEGFRF